MKTCMDLVEKPWPVWNVTFSPNGHWLAAGRGYRSEARFWLGGKGEVNVWKVEDWKLQDGFSALFTTYVQALAFTPNGKYLVATAIKYIQTDPRTGGPVVGTPNPWDGKVVFVWAIPDGSLAQTHHFDDRRDNRGAGFVTSLDLRLDGERIGLSLAGNDSMMLQSRTGRLANEVGNNGRGQEVAFSPDGKTQALAVRSWVQIRDAGTGKELANFEPKFENPAQVRWGDHGYELVGDRPTCLRYTADGKLIIAGASDGSVRLLSADLKKQLSSLEVSPDKEWVVAIASEPTTKLLVAATPSSIRLFETSTGRQLHEWGKADLMVSSVALSPDGKLLAVGYCGKHNVKGEYRGGYVNIWDTATGQLVKKLD